MRNYVILVIRIMRKLPNYAKNLYIIFEALNIRLCQSATLYIALTSKKEAFHGQINIKIAYMSSGNRSFMLTRPIWHRQGERQNYITQNAYTKYRVMFIT